MDMVASPLFFRAGTARDLAIDTHWPEKTFRNSLRKIGDENE
jgi:hypothetical protein